MVPELSVLRLEKGGGARGLALAGGTFYVVVPALRPAVFLFLELVSDLVEDGAEEFVVCVSAIRQLSQRQSPPPGWW